MRGLSMSTRRIDGPGSLGGDAIGALVAQLPGATRLSHVLTAGAKHLEEQQKRKSADVAGYARSQHGAYFHPNNDPYAYNPNVVVTPGGMVDLRALVGRYKMHVVQMIAAGRGSGMESLVEGDLDDIKNAASRAKDLDYLREQDMYVALAFIATTTDGINADKRMWARQLLREALHHDLDDVEGERAKALRLINQARHYMGPDVAYVNLNNPKWAVMQGLELERLDKKVRGNPLPPTPAEKAAGKSARRQTEDDIAQEDDQQRRMLARGHKKAQRGADDEADEKNIYSYRRNPDDEEDEREAQLRWQPKAQ